MPWTLLVRCRTGHGARGSLYSIESPPTCSPPSAEQDTHPLLARLRGYRIIDLELTHDQPPVQQRVRDVQWPPSSLVSAVRRNRETFAPHGQTVLRKGDRLTVLVSAEHAATLADVVHATQHC